MPAGIARSLVLRINTATISHSWRSAGRLAYRLTALPPYRLTALPRQRLSRLPPRGDQPIEQSDNPSAVLVHREHQQISRLSPLQRFTYAGDLRSRAGKRVLWNTQPEKF